MVKEIHGVLVNIINQNKIPKNRKNLNRHTTMKDTGRVFQDTHLKRQNMPNKSWRVIGQVKGSVSTLIAPKTITSQ